MVTFTGQQRRSRAKKIKTLPMRLRRIGFQGNYAYFRGTTGVKASPYFKTKTEAQNWKKKRYK